jgi:hypothetical protein
MNNVIKYNVVVLEWMATVGVIIAIGLNSANVYPTGPIIHLISNAVWIYVAFRWQKMSLMLLALCSTIVGLFFLFV